MPDNRTGVVAQKKYVSHAVSADAGDCPPYKCRPPLRCAGTVALLDRAGHETGVMSSSSASAFAGFRFPREVISVAVRWYLRHGLSYRDVEELLAERGVTVDHVTVYRWVQRFTPEFVEAARPRRHVPGDRWFVDETYLKVKRTLDLPVSGGRPARAGHRRVAVRQARPERCADVLHSGAGHRGGAGGGDHRPGASVPTGRRRAGPTAMHNTGRYANNRVEADHGRLKARLRPMRGVKTFRSARILAIGHAFARNLRRGHYDIVTDAPVDHRLPAAFAELALAI